MPIVISMDDNKRSSLGVYRKHLYQKLIARKMEVGALSRLT